MGERLKQIWDFGRPPRSGMFWELFGFDVSQTNPLWDILELGIEMATMIFFIMLILGSDRSRKYIPMSLGAFLIVEVLKLWLG